MNKPPLMIILLSGLFIAAGLISSIIHFVSFRSHSLSGQELLWIVLLNVMAIIAGIFMLRRHHWAAWPALVWMAVHIGISLLDSRQKLMVHSLIFVLIAWLLFRPASRAFFQDEPRSLRETDG